MADEGSVEVDFTPGSPIGVIEKVSARLMRDNETLADEPFPHVQELQNIISQGPSVTYRNGKELTALATAITSHGKPARFVRLFA